MIYIGFSTRSHKIFARILCRKYRHCAPILIMKDKCIMYQFIARGKISLIALRLKDLNILKHYGWEFIKYDRKFIPRVKTKSYTCVQFTKQSIGINKITIQTPNALLKYLKRKSL